jgi:uncharacterized protein
MAPPKHSPKAAPAARPDKTTLEVVDPVWLVKALGLTLAVALLCAYLTACLLFYQGIWQLVLHPSHAVDRTPASAGLAFTPVRFGDFNTGTPHLTGWWVPAEISKEQPGAASRPQLTVLYLHDGSGSLSDTPPVIAVLHSTGVNVFAIDYRGFGASDSVHPDADRMAQDASAAFDYLVATQHVAANSIVPMGSGLGASLAVQLAHDHPELPAVMLDNPDPNPAATAAAASPSKIIPIRLLFGARFAIAGPLAHLTTPKLLIAGGRSTGHTASPVAIEELSRHAAAPNQVITLSPENPDAVLQDALRRFLDQYVTQR